MKGRTIDRHDVWLVMVTINKLGEYRRVRWDPQEKKLNIGAHLRSPWLLDAIAVQTRENVRNRRVDVTVVRGRGLTESDDTFAVLNVVR